MMRTFFALLMAVAAVAPLAGCDGSATNEGPIERVERTGDYPGGTYGIEVGDTIANHAFQLPTDSGDTKSFSLDEGIYKPGAKALLFVTAAEWCTACRDEAPKLQAIYEDFRDQGLEVVTAIFEDAESGAANPGHAVTWIDLYDLEHIVVVDPDFVMQQYYDPNNTPLVMVIDVDDMTIQYKAVGLAESNVRAVIGALL